MPVVTSAFGRLGPHIVAEDGDYKASQITNDSDVSGDTVADAEDALAANILTRASIGRDLGGSANEPQIVGLRGRDIADLIPNDGDWLTWSEANQRWEPKASSASAATPWDVIYDKDLRTLDSQPIRGGSNNLFSEYAEVVLSDGVRWSFHGAAAAAWVEHGVGIHIQSNSPQRAQVYNAYAGARVCVVCESLPGWNPARKTAVQCRFNQPLNPSWQFGATSYQANGWGYGPGVNNSTVRLRRSPALYWDVNWVDMDSEDVVAISGNADSSLVTGRSWVFANVVDPSISPKRRSGFYHFGTTIGAWPALEDMTAVCSSVEGIDLSAPTSVGFYGGTLDGICSLVGVEIRILQRDVL